MYAKIGKTSKVRSKGDLTKPQSERLVSRMLLSQQMGSVPAERRMFGDYALQPRELEMPTSPQHPVNGTTQTVTESGVASRGNVIHTRYLKGVL